MTDIARYQPPSSDDLAAIQQTADTIARTSIVPTAYRGKPAEIIAATLMGRELGLGTMTALQFINVIQGRPTLSAEARVALARRAGHSIRGEVSAESATAVGKRGDTGDEMSVTFTLADAKRAGLRGDNWSKYPGEMCWARAVSSLCRKLFPDVMSGIGYDAEEVESFTEARGEVTVADSPPPSADGAAPPPAADDVVLDAEIVDDDEVTRVTGLPIEERQRRAFFACISEAGLDYAGEVKPWLCDNYGVESLNDLLGTDQMQRLMQKLATNDGIAKMAKAVKKWHVESGGLGAEVVA